MTKILVDVPADSGAVAALGKTPGLTFDCIDPPAFDARPLDIGRIRDVDVLFCSLPPTNVAEMKRLKWIQVASAGYSQLFGLGLPERGIVATNARGCFDVPIGEWNLSMMVNLARNLRQMIRNQEAGIWDRAAIFQREIRGLTVGLWGYGGIGRETARVSRNAGLRVHVLARNGVGPSTEIYSVPGTGDPEGVLPDRVFGPGQETEFLASLDFLVVALPLTKATENLIGERELRALRPTAFLLNPARGPIVSQDALLKALREGWISGAALDTHYHYPMPADHPLWRFPNVIMTPHISGSTLSPRFKERLWDIFSKNLPRFMRGERLLNQLTPGQLAGQ